MRPSPIPRPTRVPSARKCRSPAVPSCLRAFLVKAVAVPTLRLFDSSTLDSSAVIPFIRVHLWFPSRCRSMLASLHGLQVLRPQTDQPHSRGDARRPPSPPRAGPGIPYRARRRVRDWRGCVRATGKVANQTAGPALVLSFGLAGLACVFAGLCYCELPPWSLSPVRPTLTPTPLWGKSSPDHRLGSHSSSMPSAPPAWPTAGPVTFRTSSA